MKLEIPSLEGGGISVGTVPETPKELALWRKRGEQRLMASIVRMISRLTSPPSDTHHKKSFNDKVTGSSDRAA